MSQGHSYADLNADTEEGKALRKQVGGDFVNAVKVGLIEDYAKDNNLDPKSKDIEKQYHKYVLGKIQNLEIVLTKGVEEFMKLKPKRIKI